MHVANDSFSETENLRVSDLSVARIFRRFGKSCCLLEVWFCVVFILMPLTSTRGNPILVGSPYDNHNPMTLAGWFETTLYLTVHSDRAIMSAEKVVISVGRAQSTVTGRYAFSEWSSKQKYNQPPRSMDRQKLTRRAKLWHRKLMVYIPVLLADGSADEYEKDFGTPAIVVKDRMLRTRRVVFDADAKPVSLPRGWSISWYQVEVPYQEATGTFSLDVTYVQPHFPDGRVGYVPFFPPKSHVARQKAGRVVFRALDGMVLRRVGFFSFLSSSSQELTFTPRHRKLISVSAREAR
jgi:hypothetical protein